MEGDKTMWWENSDEHISSYNIKSMLATTIIGGAIPLAILIRNNIKSLKLENKKTFQYTIYAYFMWMVKLIVEILIITNTISFSLLDVNILYNLISLSMLWTYYKSSKTIYKIYTASNKEYKPFFFDWLKPLGIVFIIECTIIYGFRMCI